jgi:hypothetical protein
MVRVGPLTFIGAVVGGDRRGDLATVNGTRRTMRWTAGLSLALWLLTTLVGAGLPNI